MGLWSDITSAIGSVFGAGGGNSNPSSDDQDNLKKKQNNSPQLNLGPSKVNLPSVLKAPPSGPKAPIFTPQDNNNSNLSAQQPTPPNNGSGGGFWHDLTHNPVTNFVGHDVVSPTINAGKDVGEVAAAAVPEVGLGALRVGTGLVQGVTQVPHILTAATATGTKALAGTGLPGTGVVNDIAQGANTGVKTATNFVNKPINWVNRGLDTAAQDYSNVGPLAGMGEQDYKDTQIPLNIIAGLATLGGSTAAEGAGAAGDAGQSGGLISKISDFLNASRGGSDSDIVSKIAQPVVNVTRPVVSVLNAPVKGVRDLIRGGEASEGAAGVAGEETTPTENTPPESGTTPPEEPVNAPAGEQGTPTTAPGAPESGTKPVTPPTGTPTAAQLSEMEKSAAAPSATPPTSVATPADVQAAENTAQGGVDKASENPPTPAPAPTAAAANASPEQAAAEQVAASPEQQVVNEAPNIEKTGNKEQDLQNSAALVQHLLQNGRDYGGSDLQQTLDLANAHLNSNNIVSRVLNSRLGETLTDSEAKNVRDAIESGNTSGLSEKEGAVVKAIQENIENPSNVTRTNLSKDYQAADNHFPQVRETSVKDAVKGASQARGVNAKINTFNDLLNRDSRFSQGSSLGKFTSAGKTIIGDAPDLGLVAKKDGTFVDKAGKVYNYSRATSQELENAGVKLQAPKDALAAYTRDTLNLKTRADAADYLVKNADNLGLSEAAGAGKSIPVSIKGSGGTDHTFFTDAKTAKDIKDSGIIGNFDKEANLPTRAWNALSSLVAQATVLNPSAHSLNLLTNADIAAGPRALVNAGKSISEAQELRMSDAGVHIPTYGKDSVNALSKLTHGATKLNERAIAAIDKQTRAGMFDALTSKGMTDKQAAQRINDYLGGRNVYSKGGAQLGIFWKYFIRQNVNAGRIIAEAAKGHPQALINAAVAGAATYGADKGLQAATGNQGASIHAPGVIGIGSDYLKSGEALASGQFRNSVNPVVNHVNPLVSQVAEQTLGVNNYGDKFKNGASRVDNVLSMSPVTNLFNDNGHSVGEKVLNTSGTYLPHIKGAMAVSADNPLAPVLNVKGAQNASTVAFPKDFTGEQNAKAVNDYLGQTGTTYSSKTAATVANQTQAQQKASIAATKSLKTVGITNPADVNTFSKLSSDDQTAYIKAAQQVLQGGGTASSSTVQTQLVKNGHVAAAANLNTSIPSKLSQNDKNALETYSTAGNSGQQAVWLQDNTNANNYYKAVINQKAATGALTNEDKDTSGTWSGTGNTLAVKALVAKTNQQNNVPQDLVQLYENTTKTQYDNMSGAQKDALTKYAQELSANGVTDKFGIANGTSGSSKNNLPSGAAIVKPSSGSGLTAGSAKYVAPTLATATVGSSKNGNPFVRSISASKGVKI